MYSIVFYFFYRYFLYRNDSSPVFGAICGVFLTIGLQVMLAYVVIQKFVGHALLNPLSQHYSLSKLLNMLILLPFLFLTIRFFNKKRTDSIISKYDNRKKAFTPLNWMVFITLTIVPLVVIIVLLQK